MNPKAASPIDRRHFTKTTTAGLALAATGRTVADAKMAALVQGRDQFLGE